MKDLFVRRVYTHKNGIGVVVEIDYINKQVSMVDKDGTQKRWVFAERTPEYLNGWRNILIAMEWAVQEVQKEFKAVSAKEHKEFVELYMKLDQSLKAGKK